MRPPAARGWEPARHERVAVGQVDPRALPPEHLEPLARHGRGHHVAALDRDAALEADEGVQPLRGGAALPTPLDAVHRRAARRRQEAGGPAEAAAEVEDTRLLDDAGRSGEFPDERGAADVVLVGGLGGGIPRQVELGHSLQAPTDAPEPLEDARLPCVHQ